MTVIIIILILAAYLIPVAQGVRQKAQKTQCMSNLRQLHIATDLYLQNNNSIWPQTNPEEATDIAKKGEIWLFYLKPYGITAKNWQCPSLRSLDGKRTDKDFDYIAMPFSYKPRAAYQYPTQPWFVEVVNVHGNGQIVVFTDGSVHELNELLPPK